MATVRSIKEIEKRGGNVDVQALRNYTRTFRVVTDDATAGTLFVRTATGVPRIGDPFVDRTSFDNGSICVDVDAQPEGDDPFAWLIVCKYSSGGALSDYGGSSGGSTAPGDPTQWNQNPLLRPAVIKWDSIKFMEPVEQAGFWGTDPLVPPQPPLDTAREAPLNSALKPFVPVPEKESSHRILIIERNETTFREQMAEDYEDAVNTDVFMGRPARKWKCEKINGDWQFENNVFFWRVHYEFQLKRDGWHPVKILDRGYEELLPRQPGEVDFKWKKFMTTNAVPEERLLNGQGRARPIDGVIVYRYFKFWTELPFGPLNLP